MKIKWKCLLRRLILPIVAAIIIFASLSFILIYVIPMLYQQVELNETQLSQSYISNSAYQSSFIYPFPFILLFALGGFILVWVKDSVKPCIITENTITDSIGHGISAIVDLLAFVLCLILGLTAIFSFIAAIFVSPGYLIFAIPICVSIYFIYPYNDHSF